MEDEIKSIRILIAEDDEDDYLLMKEAIAGARFKYPVDRVQNGEQLMDHLHTSLESPKIKPSLILLDLNMPLKSGREVLAEINCHPDLKMIPIIVLTTSSSKEDIALSYDLGVNSFVQKPLRFEDMVNFFQLLQKYWIEFVKLPSSDFLD